MYNSALKWAYESNDEGEKTLPMAELETAVTKARVGMSIDTFVNSFYFWESLTQPENFPLGPRKRILPFQHAWWNPTKYGSDVKTQACESFSARLPEQSPGTKAYNRIQMNIFANVHKGAQMF